MKYRFAKAALFVVSATALLAGTVSAQEYPARPIRSIVPFAAGASYDTIMRIVGESAGQSLGVPIVIENRPGASATIGADMLFQGHSGRLHHRHAGQQPHHTCGRRTQDTL